MARIYQEGRLLSTIAGILFLHCLTSAEGACDYGRLPGTMVEVEGRRHEWRPYDESCQLQPLLSTYLGLPEPEGQRDKFDDSRTKDVSILLLGDSVDRSTVWDINDTVWAAQSPGHRSLLNEHWRVALTLPRLEVVYQFTPGSHIVGPYHDDVSWNKSVANALPRGFELHRLLTGRESPNVVVFSNILWDLGRWLFLSEIAEPERMDHFGKPLLREQEFLPVELLEEWRQDTEWQMERIEKRVPRDTVLIYHNAAFALLANCKNGTDHYQKGLGKRTHIAQLNALSRQIVSKRPRWHLVDLGAMSETYLGGGHLRDEHHPNRDFILQVFNIYLNLHAAHGKEPRPRSSATGDVARWDAEFVANSEKMQEDYLADAEEEFKRMVQQKERLETLRNTRLRKGYDWLMKVRIG